MTEIVRTRAEEDPAQPALLVVEPVIHFLAEAGVVDESGAAVRVRRIGDGQSNLTYRLDVEGKTVVLRRGPRPPLPPTTHDMLREARVQSVLGAAGIAVPKILAVCHDDTLLGVPFYVMEHVDGVVVTDEVPPHLDSAEGRRGMVVATVDALADLHSVDVSSGDAATLGRPAGYLERQVARFASLWPKVSRRVIPAVDTLADWLEQNRPGSARSSVVHGDFRLGNVMLNPRGPAAVQAILDWEMATLGDPLADLGYLVATYAEKGSIPTPLELTPVTRGPGFPARGDLIQRYAERTGADVSALPWYRTLALWKAAVFCEAIYTRWLDGERPGDTFGPTLEAGVPGLLAEAALAAEISVDVGVRRHR